VSAPELTNPFAECLVFVHVNINAARCHGQIHIPEPIDKLNRKPSLFCKEVGMIPEEAPEEIAIICRTSVWAIANLIDR
jgi:hypothetical protein